MPSMSRADNKPIFDAFQRLCMKHRETFPGVNYVVTDTYMPGEWTFHSFSNLGTKGNGAKALREVCELADQFGIELTLWCVVPKLFPYYESFGFRMRQDDDRYGLKYFDRAPIKQQKAA